MKGSIILREARQEDLPELQELFVETIMFTCKGDYNFKQRKIWSVSVNNLEKWLVSIKEEYFLVAVLDQIIVGFCSLKDANYLNLLYVHKDYTRKGVANLLFKAIKQKSLEFGANTLTADVSITAQPFFISKGFRVIRENKNLIEGKVIVNYHMSE